MKQSSSISVRKLLGTKLIWGSLPWNGLGKYVRNPPKYFAALSVSQNGFCYKFRSCSSFLTCKLSFSWLF